MQMDAPCPPLNNVERDVFSLGRVNRTTQHQLIPHRSAYRFFNSQRLVLNLPRCLSLLTDKLTRQSIYGLGPIEQTSKAMENMCNANLAFSKPVTIIDDVVCLANIKVLALSRKN